MILMNVDKYRYKEPLFEGARIILSYMGSSVSPEYIMGISGSAFKIAGGCPSRPTCVFDIWTPEFIRSLGYSIQEFPCGDAEKNNKMIEAVKAHILSENPALVWHAFTNAEWDVVCGFDEQQKQFIGRGSYLGNHEYERASWDRPGSSEICTPFGAILVGERSSLFDTKNAEKNSLVNAVLHAKRTSGDKDKIEIYQLEGIEFYREWAMLYSQLGKERDVADAYCWEIYASVRQAAVTYLREIAVKYPENIKNYLRRAADHFEEEVNYLDQCKPHLSWNSPWGVNEERSDKVAPLIKNAANCYEKAIECVEKAISIMDE